MFLLISQVQKRENNRCATTGAFDEQLSNRLLEQGRPIPSGLRLSLQAAHTFPLSLNQFQTASELVDLGILSLLIILTCPTAYCCYSMRYATIMQN